MNRPVLFLAVLLFVSVGGRAIAEHAPSSPELTATQLAEQKIAVDAFNHKDWKTASPIFVKLASIGDAQSEADLGQIYYHGWGVKANQAKAFVLLSSAATQNNSTAEDSLGELYHDDGMDEKAFDWYTRAAQAGNVSGEADLGEAYQAGAGTEPSSKLAWYWDRHAAAQGNAKAENNLGTFFDVNGSAPRNFGTAMHYYRLAAAQGDQDAMNNIGMLYLYGFGVPVDYTEAMKWFQRSLPGCTCSLVKIGYMYDKGLGVPQSNAIAFSWYTKAAMAGDPDGEHDLGLMYQFGEATPVDNAKALYWYEQAADQGSSNGETDLGIMYRDGLGVTQDYTKAARLFLAAAEQDNIDAIALLADAYRTGNGIGQNYAEAALLYAIAADAGDPSAQVDLGYAYEVGNGVQQDYATDLKWALITKSILERTKPVYFYKPQEVEYLTSVHMQIDLNNLSTKQIAGAKIAAMAWLLPRGIPLDNKLIPYRMDSRLYLVGAEIFILCLYAFAKFMQRRQRKVKRDGVEDGR